MFSPYEKKVGRWLERKIGDRDDEVFPGQEILREELRQQQQAIAEVARKQRMASQAAEQARQRRLPKRVRIIREPGMRAIAWEWERSWGTVAMQEPLPESWASSDEAVQELLVKISGVWMERLLAGERLIDLMMEELL